MEYRIAECSETIDGVLYRAGSKILVGKTSVKTKEKETEQFELPFSDVETVEEEKPIKRNGRKKKEI